MKVTKEYIKTLPEGGRLIFCFEDMANMDSAYQTSLTARRELGLDKNSMRISRYAKEMKIEIERYRQSQL